MSVAKKDFELYSAWKSDPGPHTLVPLMQQLDPIIKDHVKRWSDSGISPLDLRAESKDIVYNALHNYNPQFSQLNTHVTNSLRQLSRFVTNNQNPARLPEHQLQGLRQQMNITTRLREDLGREPNPEEILNALGNNKKLSEYKPVIQHFYSASINNPEAQGVASTPIMEGLTMNAAANAAFAETLTTKQRKIFDYFYSGINRGESAGKKLAQQLGVTEGAVSKMKSQIEDKFRKFSDAMQGIL